MKTCEYCGATAEDSTLTCPHCSSTKFLNVCPRCGAAHEGTVCPACCEADKVARETAEAQRVKAEAEQKANRGLIWKTVLTVFMPYVGGYFLINENIRRGFRVFGIVWCTLLALMMGTITGYSAGVRVLASVLCLAPIAVYLFKSKEKWLENSDLKKKLLAIAFCIVLVVAIIGDVVGAAVNSAPEANESPSAKAAVTKDASALVAKNESVRSASAANVTVSSTTDFLEYSNKGVDPITLVKCSDANAKVTTDDKIDLTKVGTQTVTYKVSLGGDTATQAVEFMVRDTKAPVIKLSNDKPSIDQGSEFNPLGSISSVSDVVDGNLARVDEEPQSQGANIGNEVFYDAGWYIVDGLVDSATPGAYSLIVKASDKHGNVSTRELLVTVNEVVQEAEEPVPAPAVYTYIVNRNTGKFHLPGCRDVAKMKESNKEEITATRQEMLDWGYSPCGHCHP